MVKHFDIFFIYKDRLKNFYTNYNINFDYGGKEFLYVL